MRNGKNHSRTEIVLDDFEQVEVLRGFRIQADPAADRVVDVLHRSRLGNGDSDDFAIRQQNLEIDRWTLITILLQSIRQEFLHGVALRYYAHCANLLQILLQTASSRVKLLLAQSATKGILILREYARMTYLRFSRMKTRLQ